MELRKFIQTTIREYLNEEILKENVSTFDVEKETDKALFVKIPYWLETGKDKPKHEQKELGLWIPKSQIKNNVIPQWIIDKTLQDLKQKNRFINTDSIKKHLGEYAPKKEKVEDWIPDDNAKREYERKWIKSLPKEYQNVRFPIDVYYNIDEIGTQEELNYHKEKMDNLKTKISIVLSYLSRYGNENTVDYITKQLENSNLEQSKLNLYNNILNYVNKFGFNRLYSLSLQRRNRVIKRYSEYPVTFTKLTFRGRSRLKQNIISYNTNYNSKINAFINISWLGRGSKLSIPVKYSKHYHGLITDYHKDNPDVEYMVVFDKNKIKVNICKDGQRFIPENKIQYIGIDVNVKHNLFTLSNGINFDYNRNLLNDLSNELIKINNLKKDKRYIIGKKKQRMVDSFRNKIRKSNEQLCSDVCKYLNSINKNHIVMENLDNGFGKSFIRNKNNNNINFNRIVKGLNLSSLKDMVEHVSRKYDIAISTIHSSYTSKCCSKCGCIDDGNRLLQEEFKCVECGYENNADVNAAINIENRVSSTVLRSNLLKQRKLGNGSFEPKVLKREKVKEILLSLRYSPPLVDMDMVKVNTFDYI